MNDGKRFKRLRKLRKNMTQKELADRIGVSEPTIRRMEKDDPTVAVEIRAAAAKALGAGFDWKRRELIPPDDVQKDAMEAVDFDAAAAVRSTSGQSLRGVLSNLRSTGISDDVIANTLVKAFKISAVAKGKKRPN
jgi:transcriptional regulator with XRE-family HTH domain